MDYKTLDGVPRATFNPKIKIDLSVPEAKSVINALATVAPSISVIKTKDSL